MPCLPEPSSTQTPPSIGEPSALKTPSTSTLVPSGEEMLARGCAWPLPITPMNTEGRKGRNKIRAGQVFGRLQVLTPDAGRRKTKVLCECMCSCGNVALVESGNLVAANTRSCGCLSDENRRTCQLVHGHRRRSGWTSTYTIWRGMRQRCEPGNAARFPRYAGRGIAVCERWSKYENFLADMGLRTEGLTLERVNNDGNYEPGNCKWGTWCEQAHNTSKTKLNWDMVREIRTSREPRKSIAERLGISVASIEAVRANRQWVDPKYTPSRKTS